jgi:sterol desaturase/sphingolipid hydroxylase (fatty acid hydroxylase superfamily)
MISAAVDTVFSAVIGAFDQVHEALFEHVVQPLVFATGFGSLLEDAYVATAWFLVGVLQIVVMLLVIRSLERWRPAEPAPAGHSRSDDVAYTLFHRLGAFRLLMFFVLQPLADTAGNAMRTHGFTPWQLDAVWPGLSDIAWVSFLIYLLVFDLVDYGIHRMQHGVHAWWQLHALHHSQRHMTMWSDNRNHLLDDTLRDAVLVAVALLVGVAPAQFMGIVAITQLHESLQHANVRLSFGPWLGRVLVSPAFHRHHHAIGVGHESHGPGSLGGQNFGVLFTFWDTIFGTAEHRNFQTQTGIRDQLPEHGARAYGQGLWQQQWLGLKRLVGKA